MQIPWRCEVLADQFGSYDFAVLLDQAAICLMGERYFGKNRDYSGKDETAQYG
jgi:hypothetical protein